MKPERVFETLSYVERVSKSSPLSGESLERVLNLGEDLRDSAQSDLVVPTFCIPLPLYILHVHVWHTVLISARLHAVITQKKWPLNLQPANATGYKAAMFSLFLP